MSIEMSVFDFVENKEVVVAVRYATGKPGQHAVQMCVPFKRWLELCEFFSHTLEDDGYRFEGRRSVAKHHMAYWLENAEYVNWTYVEDVPDSHAKIRFKETRAVL